MLREKTAVRQKRSVKKGARTQSEARHEVVQEHKIVESIEQPNSNIIETKTYIDRRTLTFSQVQWSECQEEVNYIRSWQYERRTEALATFRANLIGTAKETKMDERVRCSIVAASIRDRQKRVPKPMSYLAISPNLSVQEQERRVISNLATKNMNDQIKDAIAASNALKTQAEECEQKGMGHKELALLAEQGNVVAQDVLLVYKSSSSLQTLRHISGHHLKKSVHFHLPLLLHMGCYDEKGKVDTKRRKTTAAAIVNVADTIRGESVLYNDFCGLSIHHLVFPLSSEDLKKIFTTNRGKKAKIEAAIKAHFMQPSRLRLTDVEKVLNTFVRNLASKLRDGNHEALLEAWKRYLICWRMVGHYFYTYDILRDTSSIDIRVHPFDFLQRLAAVHPDWEKDEGSDHIKDCAKSCEKVFSSLHAWKMGTKGMEHHFQLWPFHLTSTQKSDLAL